MGPIMKQPVAIVGMGCLCALGEGYEPCTEALFMTPPTPYPPQYFETTHTKRYPVFEMGRWKAPSTSTKYMRTTQLGLSAAKEAIAVVDKEMFSDTCQAGVCVGSTVGVTLNNEPFYRRYRLRDDPSMAAIYRYLKSNPAQAVANELGFQGPCQTIANACSSGTDAIGVGARWIAIGLCDWVLAGGTDELCRTTYNGFIALQITSNEPCRPFDANRTGLNLGEGAAFVLMASDTVIHKTGLPVKGHVLAYGAGCDAYHLTAPAPDGRGLGQALDQIFETDGIEKDAVAFVNAHGTGTKDNDLTESSVLATYLPGVPFISTKRYTGHTLGAAGAIEAVLTLGCLEVGKIPPSAGFDTPDSQLPAAPVKTETLIDGSIALSQSLAFGGNNAVLALAGTKGIG